jgi:ATP-dependent helicase HrpA
MIPALARAASEATGADIPEDAFRRDAIAAYLRATIRIVDAHGTVLGQGREVDALLAQYGARARAEWKKTEPVRAADKKGLTTWDFGELAPFVVRRVGNVDVRSYPALVDQGKSVDLVLLESSAAAEAASRAGVRRLFMLAARQTLSAITPRLPAAFTRPNGAAPSRAESETFRATLLQRIVDAAFDLEGDDVVLPRDKLDFERRLREGTPRIDPAFRVFVEAIKPVSAALDELLRALRNASKHPSGRHALEDIYAQLEHLFPDDLIAWVPLRRLDHYPRYLRAAQARLQRAIGDPRKDADKLAPFKPLWTTFLAKRANARDQDAARDLRWAFEELRVAIFAPELKTPVPVSVAKITAALAALTR